MERACYYVTPGDAAPKYKTDQTRCVHWLRRVPIQPPQRFQLHSPTSAVQRIFNILVLYLTAALRFHCIVCLQNNGASDRNKGGLHSRYGRNELHLLAPLLLLRLHRLFLSMLVQFWYLNFTPLSVGMAPTTNNLAYEVAIPSAVLSTITVLVVDVLVVLLIHHSLLKMGKLLALRHVLLKKKAIRISEMRFEDLTGRTHGPIWFRYTQALLKVMVFAASVMLSLFVFEW